MKKTILLLCSLLFGFLILELGVRMFVLARGPYELPLFEPRSGSPSYRLLPDRQYDAVLEGRPVKIQTDAWGNAGDLAVPPERTAGPRRIAVLGDSFAFGLWAADHRHSMVGIAAELTGAQGFEWVNFAVPGYGFADMRLRLEQEVLRWQPDWLLLCAFPANDFRENYLGPDQTVVTGGVALPNEKVRQELIPAELRPPESRRPFARIMRPLRRTFRSINLASRLLSQRRQPAAGPDPAADRPETLPLPDNFLSFAFWSRTDAPPIQAEAIALGLEELQAMADICRQNNIRLAVVLIPYLEQVYVRKLKGPGYDLHEPQRQIARFCADRNIPYLDLLPAFRRAAAADPASLYCRTDPHFNDAGHAVAGQQLADFAAKLLPPPPL